MSEPTKQEIRSAVEMIGAVGEAIREAGAVGIPAGHLYVMLMNDMTHAAFESMIGLLERARLISRENNLLRWIGPELPAEASRTSPPVARCM
jgi:hypothetical protein